jgi:NADH-quinone oxidoreductase subunit A
MNSVAMPNLLLPPVLFVTVLLGAFLFSAVFSTLSYRRKKGDPKVSEAPYACGEDFSSDMSQPDYSQFFPFAFFFTILHVVVLMITTVPRLDGGVAMAAALYILGAVLGLTVLLRK